MRIVFPIFTIHNKFLYRMKKTILSIIAFSVLSIVAVAQNKTNSRTTANSPTEVSATQKNAAKECKELDKQLTTLFGADYSLTDPKVIAQLQKNIDDKNASPVIRKYSLFVAYGTEYTQHVNRIQTNK